MKTLAYFRLVTYEKQTKKPLLLVFIKILVKSNQQRFIFNYGGNERHSLFPCELHYFVMTLEDRAFVNHHGIHMKSIIREVYKFILRKKHGGTSTIDMQMVRTITGFKEKPSAKNFMKLP